MDAIAGAALGYVGGLANEAVQAVIDPDNKKGVDWDTLLAPIQEQMEEITAKTPGLELLALPQQTQLVLHQKFEPAELFQDMASMFVDGVPEVETPNTYAVRDHSGVTYYLIKEKESFEASIMRSCCRRNMPLHFDVISMKSGQVVGSVISPCACDDDCCGCVCCCIPVCPCMRTAEWVEQPSGRVLAHARKVPLFGPCSDCCNKRLDLTFPEDAEMKPLHWYKDDCDCLRNPYAVCCECKCRMADMFYVDSKGIELPPGPDEGQMDAPGVALGRLWNKYWVDDYQPTTERYPNLNQDESLGDAIKTILKESFTDADTYLVELPEDAAKHKAGMLMAAVLYDMIWAEQK